MSRWARWLGHELVAEVTAPPFHAVMPAVSVAGDIARSARLAHAGIAGVRSGRFGRFGMRDQIETSIGGEIVHGISDKRDALELLRVHYNDLRTDLEVARDAQPGSQIAPSVVATLDAYDLFYAREVDSVLIRWATEWPTYQAWWLRLRQLRETCRAAGIPLASGDPPPLPKTVWQRGAEGVGTRIDAALSLGRGAAFATMAAMGVWGLLSALRSLREVRVVERVIGAADGE